MTFKHLLISLSFFLFMSYGLPKNIEKKVNKEISEAFGFQTFELKERDIAKDVAKQLPSVFEINNFFEIQKDQLLIGYAYISKAPSKTDQFDYLILLDKELIIMRTKVLAYRENYGGEIGSKRWLQQFEGKSFKSDIEYGNNIVAISGATISAHSMTNAVNNLLQSLKILKQKNIL